MTISQRVDSLWRQMCLHEFPLSNVLWDRLKANISRMFRFITFYCSNCRIFRVKTMRNNSETVEKNLYSRHYKWLF